MASVPSTFPADVPQMFARREAQIASAQTRRRSLGLLQRVLLLESALSLLLCGGLIFPAGLVAGVLGGLALLSVPVLMKVLYEMHEPVWIQALLVAVGLPALLFLLPSTTFGTAVYFAPLVSFYVYCAVLRWRVGLWQAEQQWRVDYLRT